MRATKTFRGRVARKDEKQGVAEIVVSAYNNVDSDGDIVLYGAVAKQIAGEYGPNPKGLLDHEWSMRSAVAKTLRMFEESDGTHIEAQYNLNKQVAREAFDDLDFYGEDMEFSVGYFIKATRKPTEAERKQGCTRVITEWRIDEWSHVMLGANSDTRLVATKDGKEPAVSELQQARDIVSSVTKARKARAEAGVKVFVSSYEALRARIRDALVEMFGRDSWPYVLATMADTVVFERWVDGHGYASFQAAYTDDGAAVTLGDITEVVIEETAVPVKTAAPPAIAPAELVSTKQADAWRLLMATTPN